MMDKDSFSFVIYMIHECAKKWGKTPAGVYQILKDTSCIERYLVPHYEVLHTLGTDYITNDIEEYVAKRGVGV